MKRRPNRSLESLEPNHEINRAYQPKGKSSFAVSKFLTASILKTITIVSGVLLLIFLSTRNRSIPHDPPPDLMVRPSTRNHYTRVPEACKHTFFVSSGGDFRLPVIRALRSLGWKPTTNARTAHLVWDKLVQRHRYSQLHPWQRYNHIPGFPAWDRKDNFARGFQEYRERNPEKKLEFLPETYTLGNEEGRLAFEERLNNGGLEQPWVLKIPSVNNGRGIEMLGGLSGELRDVVQRVRDEIEALSNDETVEGSTDEATNALDLLESSYQSAKDGDTTSREQNTSVTIKTRHEDVHNDYVIQTYICNELTWFGNRKFDLRMYWMVPSIDPLVVLYSDGYARIGNTVYDETDFSDTRKHLTAMTKLADESKGSTDEYKELIRQHYERNSAELRQRFQGDPYQHVRNQMKEAIAETVAAFKDKTLGNDKQNNFTSENGFSLYGADFVLDNNLDVWYLEAQAGPALIEDYDFRVTLHSHLLRSTFALMQEIQDKIEANPEANILPFDYTIDGWDIVYAGDWMYQYEDYDRTPMKQSCKLVSRHARNRLRHHKEDESLVK